MSTTTFAPTPEQVDAVTLALSGEPFVIEALAGTGKTSTLRLIAEARPEALIQYVAFNRAIVDDATGLFPSNVAVNTVHSLAYQAVGRNYRRRINGSRRMRGDVLAKHLGIRDGIRVDVLGKRKWLTAGFLASMARKTVDRFSQTGDLFIGPEHMPTIPAIDVPKVRPDLTMAWRGENNRMIAKAVAGYAERYWKDVQDPDGDLPFDQGYYVKMWQLGGPVIHADVILYDEAQDANGCALAVIRAQAAHAQVIYVGDSYQQIYEWNGAVNALGSTGSDLRTYLTQSFRFGAAIAEAANFVLDLLDAPVLVAGFDRVDSVVAPIETVAPEPGEEPVAILCRTNAGAVREVFAAIEAGLVPALVGGAQDIVRFARAAIDLREQGWCSHPDLSLFKTWGEVQDYVEQDPSGSDLSLLVRLIDDFTAERIIAQLDQTCPEEVADLIISTAHKAKGREWARVRLAGDFPDPEAREPSPEEQRLLYVAVTRAKHRLDVRAVKMMKDFTPTVAAL
jgi:superfamily I DNA/RNA helicase